MKGLQQNKEDTLAPLTLVSQSQMLEQLSESERGKKAQQSEGHMKASQEGDMT